MLKESTLSFEEIKFIERRNKPTRLIFAIMLKYYQETHKFIDYSNIIKIQQSKINKIADQLNLEPKINKISKRTYGNIYSDLRSFLENTFSKKEHYKDLVDYIKNAIFPKEHLTFAQIKEKSTFYLKENNIEPFTDRILNRLIREASSKYELELFSTLDKSLTTSQEALLHGLLLPYKEGLSYLGWINKNFENPSLESMLNLLDQLSIIQSLEIDLLEDLLITKMPRKRMIYYADSFTRLSPSHLKSKNDSDRLANLIFYCCVRKEQILDKIIDMFCSIMSSITTTSEKRIAKKLQSEIKKIYSKDTILFNIANICIKKPDETIRKAIYPIADETKLQNIINDYNVRGVNYHLVLHEHVKNSYSRHYRRMIYQLLEQVVFKSNNKDHQPIIDGINLIKKYFYSNKKYFPKNEKISLKCISNKYHESIIEKPNGKLKRICFEVYLLKALVKYIGCREIWVTGSSKHKNPDKDLPQDFEERKEEYFASLNLPVDSEEFAHDLQSSMESNLDLLNKDIVKNPNVEISTNKKGNSKIILTPLKAQKESENIRIIKAHLQEKWRAINLLDILKELELRNNFTKDFVSYGEKVYLDDQSLSERILLSIYGYGTNIGLKHACSSNSEITYGQLKHVKNYFLTSDNIRNTLKNTANSLFKIRDPKIWGEMPVAVACDSTQFSAYFQNMISEYHNRYGGRGVMIYWHVEKKATCIYSQLKSVSSSEVASMINGVLRHCTEMSVQKSYVDTHGQSEVGFAFSYLLGFDLMPRLANLRNQKLSRSEIANYKKYKNLKSIFANVIDWNLIKEQYSEMVKHAIAMKEGFADAESILRKFTRNSLQHPTYKALAELGKAIKTIFICKYLMHESIRREIHEGLNVVELWNCVSKFVFYGRSGEISSNHYKHQELSVLSLHLLLLSVVYINTLLIQQVIYENKIDYLTLEDKRAITPLIYEHINPYGIFPLDLSVRIPYMLR